MQGRLDAATTQGLLPAYGHEQYNLHVSVPVCRNIASGILLAESNAWSKARRRPGGSSAQGCICVNRRRSHFHAFSAGLSQGAQVGNQSASIRSPASIPSHASGCEWLGQLSMTGKPRSMPSHALEKNR